MYGASPFYPFSSNFRIKNVFLKVDSAAKTFGNRTFLFIIRTFPPRIWPEVAYKGKSLGDRRRQQVHLNAHARDT